MEAFLIPVLVVVAIGLLSAIILTLAAKFMAVPVDETALAVREALPGANCGACGYAGCDDYAAALAADPENVAANLCTPGGGDTASAIASILGVDAGSSTPKMAIVRCTGFKDKSKYEMDYQGYTTCASNKLFFKGHRTCKTGCLGFGDCLKVCAYDAITIFDGVAVVDKEKCVGCGMCAKACPNLLIDIVPASNRVYVGCSSVDAGKVTRQVCEIGCIGCKLCEKACKFEAVHVENNHAVIDAEKCKNCGLCVKACPRKVIYQFPKPVKAAAKPAPKKEEGEAKAEAPKAQSAPKADAKKAAEAKSEAAASAKEAKKVEETFLADDKTADGQTQKDSASITPKVEEVSENLEAAALAAEEVKEAKEEDTL